MTDFMWLLWYILAYYWQTAGCGGTVIGGEWWFGEESWFMSIPRTNLKIAIDYTFNMIVGDFGI